MKHIIYIDGNNLYGSQMLFDLHKEDYKFQNQAFTPKKEKRLKDDMPPKNFHDSRP